MLVANTRLGIGTLGRVDIYLSQSRAAAIVTTAK